MWSRATLGEYGIAPSTSRWSGVGSASIVRAWPGWVAMTTASYVVTSPLPSVTSTPSGVSSTEVTLVPTRTSSSRGGDATDVLPRAAGDRAPGRGPEDAEHAVVVEEREQVAGGVVERDVRVAGPDRGDERLHEVPDEVRREAAVGEELAQRGRLDRLARRAGRASSARARRWKRGISASIRRYAGRVRLSRDGNRPRRPSAPAHSRPVSSSRIDIDISDCCVATPSSANRRSSTG